MSYYNRPHRNADPIEHLLVGVCEAFWSNQCFNVKRPDPYISIEVVGDNPNNCQRLQMLLYDWNTKAHKALYRNAVSIMCQVSKHLRKNLMHMRSAMMYQLNSYTLQGEKALFDRKCILEITDHFGLLARYDDSIRRSKHDPIEDMQMGMSYHPLPPPLANHQSVRNVHRLLVRPWRYNFPPTLLSQIIPPTLTSLSIGYFTTDIAPGVLPASIVEFTMCDWGGNRIALPWRLEKFGWRVGDNTVVPRDWSTSIFHNGFPDTVESISLENIPVTCDGGCGTCKLPPTTPTPDDQNTIRTQLPPRLKDIAIGFTPNCAPMNARASICTLPSTLIHLSVMVHSPIRASLHFSDCSFPLLESLYVLGAPCGLESMIQASQGLENLILVSVSVVGYYKTKIVSNRDKSWYRQQGLYDRQEKPIRVYRNQAMWLLAHVDFTNRIGYPRSVAMQEMEFDRSMHIAEEYDELNLYFPRYTDESTFRSTIPRTTCLVDGTIPMMIALERHVNHLPFDLSEVRLSILCDEQEFIDASKVARSDPSAAKTLQDFKCVLRTMSPNTLYNLWDGKRHCKGYSTFDSIMRQGGSDAYERRLLALGCM